MKNVNLAKHQLLVNHQRLYRAIGHSKRQKIHNRIDQTSQASQTSHKETRDTNLSHIQQKSVAKTAMLRRERELQHVIQERLQKLSSTLDILSRTTTRKITKPRCIFYKTERRTSQTSDVVLTPATRNPHAQFLCALSKPIITRHNLQPGDFVNILTTIPTNSVFATASTRPDFVFDLGPLTSTQDEADNLAGRPDEDDLKDHDCQGNGQEHRRAPPSSTPHCPDHCQDLKANDLEGANQEHRQGHHREHNRDRNRDQD
jgi:hypothetical protein